MRNNRPTEIRSLKGPKRKLSLEVIEGKRYIKKRDLQKYFFEDKWRISDFKYHFGLGHRIVRSSLYKWFTPEEIDKSHREKISDTQKGDNNSNSVNWYRPSKLIPLTELENTIRKVNNKQELKEKLDLTSYELSFIQQYYNFRLPNKNTLIDDFSKHHLSRREIKILAKIMEAYGLSQSFLSGDSIKIRDSILKLKGLTYDLRVIIRKLQRYYRKGGNYEYPTNIIEYQFYRALKKLGYTVVSQAYFKDLNIHVDFLINNHIILELDGSLHDKPKDDLRDKELRLKGYDIIRIDLKKERISKYADYKDIRKCLKKYLLKV